MPASHLSFVCGLGSTIRARGRLGRRAGPSWAGQGGVARRPRPSATAARAYFRVVEAQRPLLTPRPYAGMGPLRAQSSRFKVGAL